MGRACEAYLAALIVLLTLPETADAEGNWQHHVEKSAITDKSSSYWWVDAQHTVPNSIGLQSYPALGVACVENETRLIINLQDYMGSDPQTVEYRIDSGKVHSEFAYPSRDGRVIGFWGEPAIPVLRRMAGAKKVAVGAEPWNQGRKEAVFNVSGIDQVIADIRKTCGW